MQRRSKRISLSLLVITLGTLFYLIIFEDFYQESLRRISTISPPFGKCSEKPSSPVIPSNALYGSPTAKFRENLKDGKYYITTWPSAGFTNQFMGLVNMIHLGILTDRVPVIPPFMPGFHISRAAGLVPFGDIFDLNHLRKEHRLPILEWRDLKRLPLQEPTNMTFPQVETLGCWTTRKDPVKGPIAFYDPLTRHLGLNVSYTIVPERTRERPGSIWTLFPQLAELIYPENPLPAPGTGQTQTPPSRDLSKPESQLTCFECLYYVTSGRSLYEWESRWSAAWINVGRHLRFTKGMMDLGREYLAKVFGLASWEQIPPFIIVHIRRGDFSLRCHEISKADCFPSIVEYEESAARIKTKLANQSQITVDNIVVLSDESSPAFWRNVESKGYRYINHTEEKTVERFGEWYPVFIDVVVQSFAVGYVGTKSSTFSSVGQRRVYDWNGGFTESVEYHRK